MGKAKKRTIIEDGVEDDIEPTIEVPDEIDADDNEPDEEAPKPKRIAKSRSAQLKKTKKTRAEHHEEFVNLYTSDDSGEAVDMTTLDRKSATKNLVWIFITTIVGLSAIAAGLGYMVFGPNREASTESAVTVSIESVEKVGSGDQVELTINYANTGSSAIASGTVEVLYPQGFYFRSSDPQPNDASTNKWDVSGVAPGTEGTITITGQLVGQKDEAKEFTTLLTYTPANFSSDFQQSARTTITLDESIINLETAVNDQARTGETLKHVVTFTNTSSLPLVNVRAFVEYPEGFDAQTADPTASKSDHTWVFEEIAPDEKKEITIEGVVTAEGGTTLNMITQVGIEEPNGFFNIQTEASDDIVVVNPEVALSLTAPEFAAAGDTLTYDIVIENTSEVAIDAIDLVLDFTGEALESTEVSLDTIDTLEPGQKEAVTHTATVKSTLPDDVSSIVANVKIAQATVGGTDVEFTQTAETTTQLQGTMTLETEARYYDDDLTKIGSGPLPPQVGSSTNYVIRWTITATGSDMEDVKVQTALPNGITYVRSTSNDVSHSNGTVTMNIDSLVSGSSETVDFTVAVTPTKEQKGKLLVLLSESVATALDSQSQQTIQIQTSQVTSKLTNDPGVDDDGIVVGKKGE